MIADENLKSILIADDLPSDVVALRQVLRKAAILNPVRVVSSGDEVIAYLTGTEEFQNRSLYPYPAILFLDMVMPWRSGLNTLEWIKSNLQYRDFAIVAMTGIGNIDEIRRAYEKGADSFLVKPPCLEDITELINGLKGVHSCSTTTGHVLDFDKTALPHWV